MSDQASQLTAENPGSRSRRRRVRYRRFGTAQTETPPLLCPQHFRGNPDNWDPDLVEGLAKDREIILTDNRGVAGSGGVVQLETEDMTDKSPSAAAAPSPTEGDCGRGESPATTQPPRHER
jgi:pimeloyl-ACP methyl ester carboxylesterase